MSDFEKIYADNCRALMRVARKMTGSNNAIQDIVQDVFIDLYGRLSNGSSIIHPRSWLYRATLNKCIDHLRKQQHVRSMEAVSDWPLSQDAADEQDKGTAIRQAIARLKPKDRRLVVLYSEGMSYREMAEATGIRTSSIGKTLARILDRIGNELKNKQDERS